jgi:hypothetical protein
LESAAVLGPEYVLEDLVALLVVDRVGLPVDLQ